MKKNVKKEKTYLDGLLEGILLAEDLAGTPPGTDFTMKDKINLLLSKMPKANVKELLSKIPKDKVLKTAKWGGVGLGGLGAAAGAGYLAKKGYDIFKSKNAEIEALKKQLELEQNKLAAMKAEMEAESSKTLLQKIKDNPELLRKMGYAGGALGAGAAGILGLLLLKKYLAKKKKEESEE